jgi:hypothetical protein
MFDNNAEHLFSTDEKNGLNAARLHIPKINAIYMLVKGKTSS